MSPQAAMRSSRPDATDVFQRLRLQVRLRTSTATSFTRTARSSSIPRERTLRHNRRVRLRLSPQSSVLIALILFAPLQCRRASAVVQDPFDREAEEALVSYLKINTTNPPGNETAGARFLQQLLLKEGIDATLVGSNPARQSVYARLSSGTNEKALLLLHHIDVVPVAIDEWTKPPFSGLRSGGYIWGRGALDIKS